jgi:hypothetical protein
MENLRWLVKKHDFNQFLRTCRALSAKHTMAGIEQAACNAIEQALKLDNDDGCGTIHHSPDLV